MNRAASTRSLLSLAALLLAGCSHYTRNAPLSPANPAAGYRFANAAIKNRPDDLMLILAFSGGGTRAAALSYGVLEELRRTEVRPRCSV